MSSRRPSIVIIVWFTMRSTGSVAAVASQNRPSLSIACGTLRRTRPSQAREAQMAPPDVPVNATMSTSPGSFRNRPCSAPAVNAVWLPPP